MLVWQSFRLPVFFAFSSSSSNDRMPSSIVTSDAAGLGVRAKDNFESRLSEDALDDGLRTLAASNGEDSSSVGEVAPSMLPLLLLFAVAAASFALLSSANRCLTARTFRRNTTA